MPVLYVVEPGAKVTKEGQQLVISKDDRLLGEVEVQGLESVVVLSSVQVTTQALCELLRGGVEFALINSHGRLLGQLTPPTAKNLDLRRAQYAAETDPLFALTQSKLITAAKIKNQCQVLLRHALDEPGAQGAVEAAAAELSVLADRVPQVTEIAALLGLEGQAATLYWKVFPQLLAPSGLSFPGRQKHPPPDPINAALSLGYSLLTNLLTSQLDAVGFDPYLGFLHQETYGHPALALDLAEPFRAPVVDRMTLRLFNLKILCSDDFQPHPEGGLHLTDDALRHFFAEWERVLQKLAIREAIRQQLEQLARVYRGAEPGVQPWRWMAR